MNNKKQITLYIDEDIALPFRMILLNDERFTSMTDWIRQHVELYVEKNKHLINK